MSKKLTDRYLDLAITISLTIIKDFWTFLEIRRWWVVTKSTNFSRFCFNRWEAKNRLLTSHFCWVLGGQSVTFLLSSDHHSRRRPRRARQLLVSMMLWRKVHQKEARWIVIKLSNFIPLNGKYDARTWAHCDDGEYDTCGQEFVSRNLYLWLLGAVIIVWAADRV